MTFEDRIRDAMRTHDDEAPVAADLELSERSRIAGHGRRTWLPIAAAAAVVATLVGVTIGVDGGANRGSASSSGPGTSASATRIVAAPLTCPAKYQRPDPGRPWVPAKPRGVDGTDALVPDKTPARAIVCAYLGRARLTGHQTVTGDLRAVPRTLAALPRELTTRSRPCSSYAAITDGDNYLIGLTYPSGTIWVSAPGQHCDGASNGDFVTPANVRAVADAAYRTGHWPKTPIGHSGRRGQESALVPAGATKLQIVVHSTGSGKATHVHVRSDFGPLVEALNRLPTRTSYGDCRGRPGGDTYGLHFGYPNGPEVFINVVPFCRPSIDNGSLTAADATSVVPVIRNLIAQN